MKARPHGVDVLARQLHPVDPASVTPGTFAVVTDTREQRPYTFPPDVPIVVEKLDAGDLSLFGAESRVAIDRKALGDFVACCTWERERFTRELERLASYDFAAVVVEASLLDVRAKVYRAKVAPAVVVASAASFAVRYGVPVYFAGDREASADFCHRLLRSFWKHHMQPGQAA
jgi:ERCC4-type nuclease